MSRIGKQPIEIPQGVELKLEKGEVTVKGPKGELRKIIHPDVELSLRNKEAVVALSEQLSKKRANRARGLWGLWRTLIANMVQGVSEGFEKKLEIEGTGYRAAVQGNILDLSLGFSHPVNVEIPEDLSVLVDRNTVTVSGIDKEKVGQFAADIRKLRPVEPYKGKGVRYQGEVVRRKEGKKTAAAPGAAA